MSSLSQTTANRESILKLLTAAGFLVFFQTYLFAPLIPSLTKEFATTESVIGWLIPAFMIPYGIFALLYGTLGDRLGRKNVLKILIGLMVLTTTATGFCTSIESLLILRVLGGIATGGIVPLSMAVTGDLFPYKERGRPLGWIYSGMAGGAAFGSTLGAFLNPIVGWRIEMLALGVICAVVFILIFRFESVFVDHPKSNASLSKAFATYARLLKTPRGSRAYPLVFLNSAFHSGVFSWLGQYFATRYGLGDYGVGLALLGYGIPGMLGGPLIGRWADTKGRNKLIPFGLALGAVSAAGFAFPISLFWSTVVAAVLSLGYDLTQPLLGGLITSIDAEKRGQSISLSAFFLFVGFGVGPIVFQKIAGADLTKGFIAFAIGEVSLCAIALVALKNESVQKTQHLS